MPPSHQRHCRSPFKSTSFRRTSSISSSIISISPKSSDPSLTSNINSKLNTSHPHLRPKTATTGTPSHLPPLSLHLNLSLNPHLPSSRSPPTDPSPGKRSTTTFGYPSPNPNPKQPLSCDPTAYSHPHISTSSNDLSPSTSYTTNSSTSPTSQFSGFSFSLSSPTKSTRSSVFANSKSKVKAKARLYRYGSSNEEDDALRHKKKIRPFLKKCGHSLSMRSSFRLIGWIEDPVVCGGWVVFYCCFCFWVFCVRFSFFGIVILYS